jgi:hypothetical protein
MEDGRSCVVGAGLSAPQGYVPARSDPSRIDIVEQFKFNSFLPGDVFTYEGEYVGKKGKWVLYKSNEDQFGESCEWLMVICEA